MRNPGRTLSEFQKMVSINGIWLILLACSGMSMTFSTMHSETLRYDEGRFTNILTLTPTLSEWTHEFISAYSLVNN